MINKNYMNILDLPHQQYHQRNLKKIMSPQYYNSKLFTKTTSILGHKQIQRHYGLYFPKMKFKMIKKKKKMGKAKQHCNNNKILMNQLAKTNNKSGHWMEQSKQT